MTLSNTVMGVGVDNKQLIGDAPEKHVSIITATDEVAFRHLNTDMMVEILMRLPVSSVLRFRCVCKQWHGILSDPRFLHDHFKQSQKHTNLQEKRLLLFDDARGRTAAGRHTDVTPPAQAFAFDVSTRTHRFLWKASSSEIHYMIGTCNGLLCLMKIYLQEFHIEEIIILANPVTGETLTIPPPLSAELHDRMATYGFGFHPETQQFKIIGFPRSGLFGEFDKIQVYTLGDASWRAVVAPSGSQISGNVVCAAGAAHWIKQDGWEICSFDLKEERITSTRLPPPLNVSDTEPPQYTLTEVNGMVCVAIRSKSGSITNLDMWCLEDATGRRYWSHVYCVSFYMVLWYMQQYYFIHEGYFLLGKWGRNVSAYRIREKRTLYIDDEMKGIELKVNDANFNSENVSTFGYTESFAPLSIYRT